MSHHHKHHVLCKLAHDLALAPFSSKRRNTEGKSCWNNFVCCFFSRGVGNEGLLFCLSHESFKELCLQKSFKYRLLLKKQSSQQNQQTSFQIPNRGRNFIKEKPVLGQGQNSRGAKVSSSCPTTHKGTPDTHG